MTFLAPGWIALAAMASLAVAAIHLIAWRLPRAVNLPTARFVPDEPARRAARTVRPSDIALLAMRLALLMLGGVAMAQPRFEAAPSGEATVIAVERSQAIGDVAAMRESIRQAIAPGQRIAFVVFDTAAGVYTDEQALFAAVADPGAPADASLTVGLLSAIREARRLERDYETVRIVIASTFTHRAFDNATLAVRNTWPDSISLIRLTSAARTTRVAIVESDASLDDPVMAGIRLAASNGLIAGASRVVRDSMAPNMAIGSDLTLVHWPASGATVPSRVDGINAGGYTAIGHLTQGRSNDSGVVIARWVNGAPAAWEVRRGEGCLRTVGFDVPDVGDFTLTPSFQRLAAELLRPCVDEPSAVAPDSMIAGLLAALSNTAVESTPDESQGTNRLAAILMTLALALTFVELWFRRRTFVVPVDQRA